MKIMSEINHIKYNSLEKSFSYIQYIYITYIQTILQQMFIIYK